MPIRAKGNLIIQATKLLGSLAGRFVFTFMAVALGVCAVAGFEEKSTEKIQGKGPRNPYRANPTAVPEGKSIYRRECALCHGIYARGGFKGPDLTSGHWTHGGSDAAIFQTINRGVPGTDMPANDLGTEKTWKVIAYLRSLSPNTPELASGNEQAGQQIFFGKGLCFKCHMVRGQGGRLGPDLSRIGASRSSRFLADKIRDPDSASKDQTVDLWWEMGLPLPFQTVTVVTKDGRQITGVLRNEDTFSVQLMDPSEELRSFLKKDLRQVIHVGKSMMPAYGEQVLSDRNVRDLLAYLSSLK